MNKKRILIVDDNMLIRSISSDMLRSLNYEVVEANNGSESIEKAKSEIIDLILMDIHMPGMNGIEAMKRVKKIPGKEKVPIVALTASAKESDKEMLLKEGFDGYIMKPPAIGELTNLIEELL